MWPLTAKAASETDREHKSTIASSNTVFFYTHFLFAIFVSVPLRLAGWKSVKHCVSGLLVKGKTIDPFILSKQHEVRVHFGNRCFHIFNE